MPPERDTPPLRLILVEDNANYRDLLTHRLIELDCVEITHVADRSRDACSWLQANPADWDLLVLDIFLTEGHGYEVLKAVQGRAGHQQAVFLTSYTRDPARSQALALGADAVFDKLHVDTFLDYVRARCDALAHADCR